MALSPWPDSPAAVAAAVLKIKTATGSSSADANIARVGAVAAALTEKEASMAPSEVKDEAVIRCAAWLLDRPRDGRTSEVADVGPIKIDRSYLAGQLSALRHSGAMALLGPWKLQTRGGDQLMRWPWSKQVETRASYSDAVVAAILSQASGTAAAGDPGAIAALETSAGLYSRAFASATVKPDNFRTAPITPALLALIARNLIRRGESLHLIEVEGGAIRLSPVGTWDISGGDDPRSWHGAG